jgi:hypothetical protein
MNFLFTLFRYYEARKLMYNIQAWGNNQVLTCTCFSTKVLKKKVFWTTIFENCIYDLILLESGPFFWLCPMGMCMCMCIHVHICVYIYINMNISIYIFVYICIHISWWIIIWIYTHPSMNKWYVSTYKCVCIHTYIWEIKFDSKKPFLRPLYKSHID